MSPGQIKCWPPPPPAFTLAAPFPMSDSAPALRSVPRLSPTVVLRWTLLAGGLLGMVWLLRSARQENTALRAELTALRVVQRAADSREQAARDALRRVARLEETLRLMQHPSAPVEAPDAARTAELERVILFLRGEIKAAHETIERLKQEEPSPPLQ